MTVEPWLNGVIRDQHGAVTLRQLHAAGLTRGQVITRVGRGQFHRVHRGVYAVADPALLPLVGESAALLATGQHSVLSHRSAAALWGLVNDNEPKVHVTLSRDHDRRHPGLLIHRVRALDPRDVTALKRLRLTTPARSVLDLATDASIAEVEHALSEGRAQALITDAKLEAAIERAHDNHPGAAKVKALLNSRVARVLTRSERERRMLALLEEAGLPKPLVNRRLHGYVPDFYWPEHKLILEFDGHRTHGGRDRFESDRRRDQTYAALGILTVRATWLQLEHEPVALVVRVGQALAARAA